MPIFPMNEVEKKNINIQIIKKLILNYQIWI